MPGTAAETPPAAAPAEGRREGRGGSSMRPAGKATKEDRPGASFSPFPSQEDMTAPAFDDEFNAPALDKGSGDINAGATDHDHDGEDEDSWRKLGRQFRSNLMRLDAKNAFQLKSECSIERYYQVADRVMEQFLHHPIDDRDEIIEAYLIGSRLVHFLSTILPTHPEYFSRSRSHTGLRNHAQAQLSELTGYVEVLAVLLDKQEHERYISYVLEDEHEGEQLGSGAAGDAIKTKADSARRAWTRDESPAPTTHSLRLSKPPLVGRSVSSSSVSNRSPVSHDDRASDARRDDYRRRSPHADAGSMEAFFNGGRNEDQDEVSTSNDSASRPLLLGDGHLSYLPSQLSKDDDDWDTAWVKRHDHRSTTPKVTSRAVFDQEGSVANTSMNTEETSHLDPSTVDSSLMNPPDPIYQPLITETKRRLGRSHRHASTTTTDVLSSQRGDRLSPDGSKAAMYAVAGEILATKHQQALTTTFGGAVHSENDERPGPEFLSDDGNFDFHHSEFESQRSLFASFPGSAAEMDMRSSNRREPTSITLPFSQHWPMNRIDLSSPPPLKDEWQGQIGHAWSHRFSTSRDVLEDPKQRWFGNDECVSQASDVSSSGPLGQDPFDVYFPSERELRDDGARKENDEVESSGTRSFSRRSRLKNEGSEPDRIHDQDVDCSQESANHNYVLGSIRERAARRLTAKAPVPAHEQLASEPKWNNVGGLHDGPQSTQLRRFPGLMPDDKSHLRGDTPELDPRSDPSAPNRAGVTLAHSSDNQASSKRDLATEVMSSGSRAESGNSDAFSWKHRQTLSNGQESRFMVNVTIDGEECVPAPMKPGVPSHRQSAVRASADRLKAIRSRRVDHRFADNHPSSEQLQSIVKEKGLPVTGKRQEDVSQELIDKDRPGEYRAASSSPDESRSDSIRKDAMISSDDVPAALPSREEALSVDVQDATLSDQNMSIENDSVLNGEVEQILARESTMVRASYDSFRTGSVSENEDFEFEAGNGADVQAAKDSDASASGDEHTMDDSSYKCDGDDEGSETSAYDPFSFDDTSDQKMQADFRKRHEILIQAMRLEQRTYLDSSPPRAFERKRLMPSSRDMFFNSKREGQVHSVTSDPSIRQPCCEPVDLDETVDDDEASETKTGVHDQGSPLPSARQQHSATPLSFGVASSVASKTRIENRLEEASKTSSQAASPASVLMPFESRARDELEVESSYKAAKRVPKSSVASGATSLGTFGEDDDDTAMVNAFSMRKRRPLSHFRGCVRFLLE